MLDMLTTIEIYCGGPGSGRHKEEAAAQKAWSIHNQVLRNPVRETWPSGDAGFRGWYMSQKLQLEKIKDLLEPHVKGETKTYYKKAVGFLQKADEAAKKGKYGSAISIQEAALSTFHYVISYLRP